MNETFKNISIFLIFLSVLLLWHEAGEWLEGEYFGFRYGATVLLIVWSSAVVVIFHLLYHYFGKIQEKSLYLSTIITLVAMGFLVYFDKLHLS